MGDDSAGGTGLPASFEVAWGLRGHPTKGPKRGLSLERVVDAAVKVALADGFDAVSMSRVAGELGTSAMSLYRYVASKDELLALMVDVALSAVIPPFDIDEPWRAGLERWAWAELGGYRAHPWVLRVPVSGAPITPNVMLFMERGLQCLRDTRLEEHEKLSVILLLTSYTRSWATLSSDLETAAKATDSPAAHVMANYGALILKLTTPEKFPALRKIVEAGTFDFADDEDPDYDYVFGLTRVLDGIEVLVRARE